MGVRKDVISRQTASFLSYGLKRPFFFTPCMEAGCEKNLRFSSRSPRTSNFFPKSLQSAHRFRIWLFLDPRTKKEWCLNFAEDLFCNNVIKYNFYRYLARGGLLLSFLSIWSGADKGQEQTDSGVR